MRMELYELTITRAGRELTGFVVAPGKERASEIVVNHEIDLNQENEGFMLERVDETLPDNQRQGLDALLDTAPVGMASYCPPIGWIAHAVSTPKLYLYRIEEVKGRERFIVAPSGDVAATVYCEGIGLKEKQTLLFRIHDGLSGLKNESLRGLPALLEFGPIGEVQWDVDRGWSLMGA